jgi:murein tripeptide amidase MpaA
MAAAVSALALLAAGVAASPAMAAVPDTAVAQSQHDIDEVLGTASPQLRTAVGRTGVDILTATDESTTVVASPAQPAQLRKLGFTVESGGSVDRPLTEVAPQVITDFPVGDEAHHTYTETSTFLQQTAQNYPSLGQLSSAGKSYEGRNLNLIKISDNVTTDENEPEVPFTCNQHAREHLTTEMCIHIVQRLTAGYATDPAIKKLVDGHQIYLIPSVNPDGSEYDISGGRYHSWRKNRQGNGTDPNRNWSYKWGCCGGSSGSTTSETYRGTAAFSARETRPCRTGSIPARSVVCNRSRRTSTSTPTRNSSFGRSDTPTTPPRRD